MTDMRQSDEMRHIDLRLEGSTKNLPSLVFASHRLHMLEDLGEKADRLMWLRATWMLFVKEKLCL